MRPRRGAAALEYALVLPALLLVLFAIVDWSWYQFEADTIAVAANRGARAAASVPPSEGPGARALAAARAALAVGGIGGPEVIIGIGVDDHTVRVEVSMDHQALIGLSPLPDRIAAVATAVYYGDVYEE